MLLVVDIGAHGYRRQAVAVPDNAFLEAILQGRHLRQRDALAVVRGQGQAAKVTQLAALLQRAAQKDLDQLVVLAVLADRGAGQRALQEAGQVRGAHPQGTSPVLIDFQEYRLAWLLPVQVHIHHMGILAHLVGHLAGQRAGLLDMLAGNPELHRVAHGRAVFQAGDAGTQVGELLVHGVDQPTAQALPILHRLGQHHELGKAGRRQLLVQRQVEAWRPSADIGHIVVDALLLLEQRFQLFDPFGGVGQRRAFGQLQIDHQLRAPGCREELLGHETEQQDAADERCDGQQDDRLAPTHAPFHHTPHALVERGGIRVWRAVPMAGRMQLCQVRQQTFAQVRHEHHSRYPGGQQRNGHDLEDRTGVLTRARGGSSDGQEAGGGNQGAGEHREGRAGPGVTGRLEAVETLLHFDRHHLHGNDRVVHQQAQGQHQRPEGDLVQTNAEVMHGSEGHGQHQGDSQGHYQPGAQAEREEAHQQDDHQRFDQHLDELAYACLDRSGLVGNLAQLHAGRQVARQAFELAFQGLAQYQDVAAIFHRHRQPNGILAHEAHARCGRVVETTVYVSHITDAEGAVTDTDGELSDLVNAGETPTYPQLQALARRLEEARGADGVLFTQRLLHGLQRHAKGGQLEVGQFDPDLLVLQAEQLHLAHILDPLQLDLDTVGIVLEHRIVETGAGQCVEVAEGGAEFVVEERPLDFRRQGVANVRDFFADLVPQLGNVLGMQRVAGHEGHLRLTGPGERDDLLVLTGFHQFLLDALGDLARHFLGGGARPQGADDHGLEGKGRVFALAKLGVGHGANCRQQDHQEQHDLAITQRPGGKVETHRDLLLGRQVHNAVGAVHRPHLLPFSQHMAASGDHPVARIQAFEYRYSFAAIRPQAHNGPLDTAFLVDPPDIGLPVFSGNRRQRHRQWDHPVMGDEHPRALAQFGRCLDRGEGDASGKGARTRVGSR